MNKALSALVLLVLAGCSDSKFSPAVGASCQAPFVDLANSGANQEDQIILRQASEDFCAVVAGKNPVHAKLDSSAEVPNDGGSLFYVGHKYQLTVLNSLSSFGSFYGVAHGPVITFDEAFAPGNTNVISDIRVYPQPQVD